MEIDRSAVAESSEPGPKLQATPLRLFFLIRSLGRGGAERQIIELVRELAKLRHPITVCTFYDGGALRAGLGDIAGVSVLSLGKQGRGDVLRFVWRLGRAVQAFRPDVIHGYMGIANELALLMSWIFGADCVWGLRGSEVEFSHYSALSRLAFRIGAPLSRFADAIIANSESGRRHYASNGYAPERMFVVPNGIDCDRFRPDEAARKRLRGEWFVGVDEQLVGVVARIDPMKDHVTFLQAAALLVKQWESVVFVCVGEGEAVYTAQLAQLARDLGVSERVRWIGACDDMPSVYNALDIVVLSSAFGEGFPNVVGEAMATGKLCVVTQVGDASLVVGDHGASVPPRNPVALAAAIHRSLGLDAAQVRQIGEDSRTRIQSLFSTHQLLQATRRIFANLDEIRTTGKPSG